MIKNKLIKVLRYTLFATGLCLLSACAGTNTGKSVLESEKTGNQASEAPAGDEGKTQELQRYTRSFTGVFDTVTQVIGYAQSKDDFDVVLEKTEKELKKYHEYYDIYESYEGINNIKTINDNAGKEAVKVDKEIIDLLKFSKEMYEKTDGKVNIAMGSVLKLWHDKREEGILNPDTASLPDKKSLEEAEKHTDINKIIIDEEASTVYIEDENMSIDVGATAKGYATERTAEFLKKEGYNDILLSVGGNVRAIGSKHGDNGIKVPWSVGVQNPNPDIMDQSIVAMEIEDLSLVTSGVYERFYMVDGKSYHHIINPDTLFPGNEYLSVSILTSDSGVGDALSTAVFNMDLETGKNFIENYAGVEAMWVLPDMTQVYSSGFEAFKK